MHDVNGICLRGSSHLPQHSRWDMSLNEGIGREEVAEVMGGYMNKSQRGWGLA